MLSAIYGKIMTLRNVLYDKGVFDTFDLGARVISVGNITTGGTGKTPLVAYIAEVLAARGERACILTRGYRRANPRQRVLVSDGEHVLVDAQQGGDEPIELARKLIGKAIVLADAERVSAAEWALRKFGVTVFVLDDGFQHRKAERDLDIVCIDATDPFGGNRTLPFGRLREPLRGLARADAFVITRSDLAGDVTDLRSKLLRSNPRAAIFEAKNVISAVTAIEEFHAKTQGTQREENVWKPLEQIRPSAEDGIRITAFCALGNPDSFFVQLLSEFEKRESEDLDLAIAKPFPDHHCFQQKDIDELEKQAKDRNIHAFLTTAKDAAKLSDLKFTIPCFVVQIETAIDDGEAFEKMLIR